MARQFTGSEFHELVWSMPLICLAKEFALSDVPLRTFKSWCEGPAEKRDDES